MLRDRSFIWLSCCFFLSGLAALIYETAWTHEFAFVFGTSELAVATVLAAYMGGLAAGAALAGRYGARLSRPVLAYGLLELGIAIAALAVPLGISASRWLYVALFGSQEVLPDAGGLTTALFYLACSFLILLVPTAMMGATLPLLVRYSVRTDREIGRRIGALYATNTTGAVLGTITGAFVLLPALGLRATIAAAAGVNALVFAAAWGVSRSAAALPSEPAWGLAGATASGRARWILALIFASGFASFFYEVLWVRLVGHLVGSGTQAFATMLASFLAGIAIGSAIASRWATTSRRAAAGFSVAQLGIAGLSAAAFAVVNQIPELRDWLRLHGFSSTGTSVVACMMTLFPAALCIGATFPFAVRVLAQRSADASPASARVYAANTVGSIVGSIAAGFFVVPALGFAGTLVACATLNLALAAAAALLFEPRRPWLLGAAAAGGAALAFAPPGTPWRMLRSTSMQPGGFAWGKIQYFGVGRSSTVLVTDNRLSYSLRTNGLPEAGMQRPGSWPNRHPTTRWLGMLPVLARPDTRSLLLVGLGGGMAIEIMPPSVERIDVIELEPEVLEANRSVSATRWRDPLADPRVHIHLNDARNALLLASEARFDAIVSQPSHPWAGGAAHLYTREFFELVRSRLTPDGVFVQWIGLPFVDEELFRSLLAAMAEVFEHVQVYEPPPGGSALFLASNARFEMPASAARAIAASPADFDLIGLRTPEQALASLLLDEDGVRELAAGARANRDGRNGLQNRSAHLERSSTLIAQRGDELFGPLDPLARSLPPGTDVFALLRRLDPARQHRVVAAFRDPIDREVGKALAEIAEGKRITAQRRLAKVLSEQPRHVEARAALLRLSSYALAEGADPATLLAPPLSDPERAVSAAWANRDGEALRALEGSLAAIPPTHPIAAEATRLRIRARLESRDPQLVQEAVGLAEASLGDRPQAEDLLLRAEAYAAAQDYVGVLEAIGLVVERLNPKVRSSQALLRRARSLAQAVPDDDVELRRLRVDTLRRVGV